MNKVQLIGTIQQIRFDDINGKLVAEFTLVYVEKANVKDYFSCTTNGESADLLYRMWFKGIEVAIEGVLVNLNSSQTNNINVVINVKDMLFLSDN